MPKPKTGLSKDGKLMHYTVGAVIKQDDKYLLIDRVNPPFGFAGPAGHIDDDVEDEIQAVNREVKEETGLSVIKCKLLFHEELGENVCTKGATRHSWHLFECEVTGNIERSVRETKSINYYSPQEIKQLPLEPVWDYWFKKLKII